MQERRRVPRIPVRMQGKVIVSESRVHECRVRDISTLGARLEFPSTASVPDKFALTFDTARTIRRCRVAWRTDTQIGVEFQGVSIGRAA